LVNSALSLPILVFSFLRCVTDVHESQLYDMRYELNEVEARRERYPSTISYLNLVNALIREERDLSDSGHRYSCHFYFLAL
jgi:nuclear pore complex protein Nup205